MIINPLPDSAAYWTAVRVLALRLGSDGCSGPTIGCLHTEACYEHDLHYRTGMWIGSEPIGRAEADKVFRLRIQQRSPFGSFSPMAWWRWSAVRLFGSGSWQG